jgi:hypothetical protein
VKEPQESAPQLVFVESESAGLEPVLQLGLVELVSVLELPELEELPLIAVEVLWFQVLLAFAEPESVEPEPAPQLAFVEPEPVPQLVFAGLVVVQLLAFAGLESALRRVFVELGFVLESLEPDGQPLVAGSALLSC